MPRPTEPANGAAMELATMENKLKALALAAFGFATIGLASCSDIEATLPENVDNAPILNVDGIVNNNMGEIYDALVTAGDTNSERVLNNVLALYSKGLFGEFYGEGGMLEAIESDDGVKAYAAAHPVFGEGDEAVENCRAFINHIIDSVNEQMWSIVENSTYQRRSIFLEKEFYPSTESFLSQFDPADFHNELILIKGAREFHFELISETLELKQHETILEVNLDAIVHNYNLFKSKLHPQTKIICMVKAFGYGAGSYELAKTLQDRGADFLAVAVADEGAELRKAGITMPILVMNPEMSSFRTLFSYYLEPEIYSFICIYC